MVKKARKAGKRDFDDDVQDTLDEETRKNDARLAKIAKEEDAIR